jgi:hypothetical protein
MKGSFVLDDLGTINPTATAGRTASFSALPYTYKQALVRNLAAVSAVASHAGLPISQIPGVMGASLPLSPTRSLESTLTVPTTDFLQPHFLTRIARSTLSGKTRTRLSDQTIPTLPTLQPAHLPTSSGSVSSTPPTLHCSTSLLAMVSATP